MLARDRSLNWSLLTENDAYFLLGPMGFVISLASQTEMEEKLQSHASQQEITPREHDICSFPLPPDSNWETEEVTDPMLLGRK